MSGFMILLQRKSAAAISLSERGYHMEKENRCRIFISYLKQRRMVMLMFLCFSGIFAFIFSLYELQTEAVLYAAGLCILLSAVVLPIHFFFYQKRHRDCERILPNILLLIDELPAPKTLMESDLQKMLYEMKRISETNLTNWQAERSESMDYYTTWVHQIKTPISVMRMALQGEDTDEHRELLTELFRIEQYVEMVLSYLRLGSESSDYVIKEYELDSIIKQAIHKYAPQFIARKLREDLPRIFEKGFTGYNGRSDKKSTGLGLYLCKMAAERLSHKISAESIPDTGTVISIDLQTVH